MALAKRFSVTFQSSPYSKYFLSSRFPKANILIITHRLCVLPLRLRANTNVAATDWPKTSNTS